MPCAARAVAHSQPAGDPSYPLGTLCFEREVSATDEVGWAMKMGVTTASPANRPPNVRRAIQVCGLLAVWLAAPLSAGVARAADDRPNIVLILSDDQNWRDYSFTDENPDVSTPNIDALASEGVLISRSYVPTAICRASLATLFTGLHSVTTGITGNEPLPVGSAEFDRVDGVSQRILRRNVAFHATLPRILGRLGYRSLQTGKWWEGDYQRAGFDEGTTRDRSKVLGHPSARSIGRAGLEPIADFIERAVSDDVPFLISYAPLLPHVPHTPPARFRERFAARIASGALTRNQANYLAMVEWFDETVGELRALLQSATGRAGRPVEDDTLYVYLVDNGWAPLLEGRQDAVGAPRGKRSPYEDGVRNPMVLYWKGEIFDERSIEQKRGDTRLASTTDLLPTLLALVGAGDQLPPLAQGVDLLGESRNEVFGDSYTMRIPVATADGFVYDQRERARRARWLVEGRYKLIVPDTSDYGEAPQLFDLLADPAERKDLASAQPDRVQRMRERVDQWWAESRPTLRYAHEFREGEAPLEGLAPDIASMPGAVWRATGAIERSGTLGERARAWLPFAPARDRRYEFRVAGSGLAFGFAGGGGAPIGFVEGAPGWAVIDVEQDGPQTLVLDTRDGDPETPGHQWSVERLVRGISQGTASYPADARAIHFVAVESQDPGGPEGRIAALQLVETPRFESLAWLRGDTNGDGMIGLDDFETIMDEFTGAQTVPPTYAKTLQQGDVSGDGAVDWDDAYLALSSFVDGLF